MTELIKASEENADELVIKNSLSFRDYLNCFCWPRGPIVNGALLGAIVFGLFIIGNLGRTDPTSLLINLAVALLAVSVLPVTAWFSFRQQRTKFTDQVLRFDRNGIHSKVQTGSESLVDWHTVLRVAVRFDAIIIQISRSPDMFYWIPARQFESKEAANEFYSQVLGLWQQSCFLPIQVDVPQDSNEASGVLRVQAHLTFRDLLLCNFFLFGAPLVILSLLLFVIGILQTFMLEFTTAFPSFALAAALLCVWPVKTWLIYSKHKDWMSADVTISEKGLNSKGGGVDGTISWNSIKGVSARAGVIMARMDNNWAICIPMRNFTTARDGEQFLSTAKKYWTDSRTALKVRGKGDDPAI